MSEYATPKLPLAIPRLGCTCEGMQIYRAHMAAFATIVHSAQPMPQEEWGQRVSAFISDHSGMIRHAGARAGTRKAHGVQIAMRGIGIRAATPPGSQES